MQRRGFLQRIVGVVAVPARLVRTEEDREQAIIEVRPICPRCGTQFARPDPQPRNTDTVAVTCRCGVHAMVRFYLEAP